MCCVSTPDPAARTTLPGALRASAAAHPGTLALLDGEFAATYAELVDHVEDWARALIALGIEAGDRVGILAPNSARWVIAALAAADVGAVLVPLNPRAKGAELCTAIERTGVRVLFATRRFLQLDFVAIIGADDGGARGGGSPDRPRVVALDESESRVGSIGLSDFLGLRRRTPPVELTRRTRAVRDVDLLEILWTSGSTGAAKGVMLEHRQLVDCYRGWADVVGLRAEDRYPIVSPMAHGFGLNAGVIASVLTGATMLPVPLFDAESTLRMVEEQGVSVLVGPPALFTRLIDLQAHLALDVRSLRLGVCGAATVPADLIHQMRSTLGFERVVNAYGLIEGSFVSGTRAGDDPDLVARSAGRAAPGMEIRIVDAAGVDVPPGAAGEILVRGPGVMRGYWEEPELTARALDASGWLHTRDIGSLDAQGNLALSGRVTDMFVVGGFNVVPAEVENQLMECPGIAAVAVVPAPDRVLGDVPVAFVQVQPGHDLTAERVLAWAKEHLSTYKVPRRVLLQDLPVAATGKVDRLRLKAQAAG